MYKRKTDQLVEFGLKKKEKKEMQKMLQTDHSYTIQGAIKAVKNQTSLNKNLRKVDKVLNKLAQLKQLQSAKHLPRNISNNFQPKRAKSRLKQKEDF